jgi:hypothetical protein
MAQTRSDLKRILIITAEEDDNLALRFALEYGTTTNSRVFKLIPLPILY